MICPRGQLHTSTCPCWQLHRSTRPCWQLHTSTTDTLKLFTSTHVSGKPAAIIPAVPMAATEILSLGKSNQAPPMTFLATSLRSACLSTPCWTKRQRHVKRSRSKRLKGDWSVKSRRCEHVNADHTNCCCCCCCCGVVGLCCWSCCELLVLLLIVAIVAVAVTVVAAVLFCYHIICQWVRQWQPSRNPLRTRKKTHINSK